MEIGKYWDDFYAWVKGSKLVELDSVNVADDPVRPELDNKFRTGQGRKIFGLKWKEEIEEMDFGNDFKVEFNPVDKAKSMGLDGIRENRKRWVEGHKDESFYYYDDSPSGPPRGTAEEYDYRLNNLDYYFIIKVIYKDEIGKYLPNGERKDCSRDKNSEYYTGS